MHEIVEVKVLKNYRLFIRFENDVQGEVDISKIVPFKGVFAKLKDFDYFSTVYVNEDLGTIVWDNGADLSPSFLYSLLADDVA